MPFTAMLVVPLLLIHQPPATGSRLHEIREWLEAYEAAFRGGNVERLSKFYADGASIVEGEEATTWSEVREHRLADLFRELANIDFRMSESRIHLLDSSATLAVVVSVVEFHGRKVDHEFHKRTAETLVLENKGEMGWRIRHVHRSEALER